jgi:vancomycin resistance protein YoaR
MTIHEAFSGEPVTKDAVEEVETVEAVEAVEEKTEESKADKFNKLMATRKRNLMKAINLINQLSDTSRYEFESEDVGRHMRQIRGAIENMENQFDMALRDKKYM